MRSARAPLLEIARKNAISSKDDGSIRPTDYSGQTREALASGRPAHPNEGVVDWLLACPEKDFFVPIQSESTDTV